MRIGKAPRNWIRAAVIGVVLGPIAVSAEFPKPLETAGRLYGVCWGDGYHACASSGVRLGADLPPKSYSASYGSRSHVKPAGIVHRIGATYYDRFDAAKARACRGCDAPNCDSKPCDCGPVAAPHGSQVSQTPDAMGPTIASPILDTPLQPALTPTVTSEAAKATSPKPDPIIELTQPLTLAPQAKKYPTRPEPPLQLQHSNVTAVASKQQTMKFPAPEKWGQAISNRPKSQPLRTTTPASTTTPGSIDLIHPGSPPSTPARLALSSNPISTLTPSVIVPAPTEFAPPAKPQVASAPAPVPAFVPAYAIAPNIGPEAAQAPATEQRPARPVRLGTATAPAPAAAIKSVAAVKRPTRLGDAGADLQFNPFASRPVVEMAKRSGEASEGVIFQPSGGSLK